MQAWLQRNSANCDIYVVLADDTKRAESLKLVTDLRRSRLAQTAIFAVTEVFYREPMTKHDARLSAERAFSFPELRKLAIAAGWWGSRHKRTPLFRQALWLDLAARKR